MIDNYVLFALSSFVFFYGGYPFLKGLFKEIGKIQPGMMTLISVAISVALKSSIWKNGYQLPESPKNGSIPLILLLYR